MAAPILQDYQFWFGVHDAGLVFGMGTIYDVVSVQGLHSFTVRSGNRLKPREHGAIPGMHLVDQKIIAFEIEVPDRQAFLDFIDIFKANSDHEGELHWKLPGMPQHFHRARVAARSEEQTGLNVGLMSVSIGMEAADPRFYGVESKSVVMGIYNPTSGGTEWEIDWNVDFVGGGSTIGQDAIAHNSGNEAAYPIVRFFGPITGTCTGVLLRNLTAGVSLDIQTDITTGQVLTADMDARVRGMGTRIIDLSGSSRYNAWQQPRETFYLVPGDNVLRFELEAASTSEDVLASVLWRDTSI